MAYSYLMMDPADNVVVSLIAFHPGDRLDLPSGSITIQDAIPVGHKIATREVPEGDYVIKYGERIGRATKRIGIGAYAHVHNIFDITEEVFQEERRKLGL